MGNNTTVVIAGPGAGKTHNMVDKVLSALNNLKANKFCCVVTYTNAATEEIRKRISKRIDIPQNLFVGTIHSFFYKFFIIPYLKIHFDEFANSIDYENNIDITYREAVEKHWLSEPIKNRSEFKTEKDLIIEGKICYRTSVYIAYKLSQKTEIIKRISKRLQYLFVDEYQDSDHFINEIFKKLINENIIICYFIGDQMQNIQSITSFPSNIKNKVKNVFSDLQTNSNIKYQEFLENWRSSNEIVDFISNFQNFTQIPKKNENIHPVMFIEKVELNRIFSEFKELIINQKIPYEKDIIYQVILAESWKDDSSKNHIKKLSNFKIKNDIFEINNEMLINKESLYKIFEDCLIGSVKQSKKEIIENNFSDDIIFYRKEILKILKESISPDSINYFVHKSENDEKIRLNDFYTNSIKKRFRNHLNLDESSNGKKIKCDKFCKFAFSQMIQRYEEMNEKVFCSTIHKFKGLEATCVLIIASSKNVLEKYIETESIRQNKTSRLGYVAFSRARKLLSIACLEKIDDDIRKKLESLNVKILKGS